MQNSLPAFIALLKREMLEHKNLWRVPLLLLIISILLRLSFSVGNLSVDVDFPDVVSLDEVISSVLDSALVKTLSVLNYFSMIVMFIVAVFYLSLIHI